MAISFLVKYASSKELPVEKNTPQESKSKADHNPKQVSGDYDYDLEDYKDNVEESIEESNGTNSHKIADNDDESYEYVAEPDPDANKSHEYSYEEVEKDTTQEPKNKADLNSKEVSGDGDYGSKDYNNTDYYNVETSNGTSAGIICHNVESSLSLLDCLLSNRFRGFYLICRN